jgi:L-threonylcarbamoyladenylate synthase
MEQNLFDLEIEKALATLRAGGVILYPTDTIWGLGCDATNKAAIDKIYKIKQREETKTMIILVADEREILNCVAAPDVEVFDYLAEQTRPTTVIFDGALGLPDNLIAENGSIAIRIVQDDFCRHLIKRLKKPLVSTSANISGEPSPKNFREVSGKIKISVDYVVNWRQHDTTPAQPSRIIRWHNNGKYTIIRD